MLDVACILDHIPVVVVLKPVNAVDIDPGYHAVMEQPGLVIHTQLLKQLNGVICGHAALHDGNLPFHILPHLGLYRIQEFLVQNKVSPGLHEKSPADGKVNHQLFHIAGACNAVERLQHHKGRAPLIGRHARLILCSDKGKLTVLHLLMQLLELSVYPHQQDIVFILLLVFPGRLQPGGALRVFLCDAVYLNQCHSIYLPQFTESVSPVTQSWQAIGAAPAPVPPGSPDSS